MKIIYSILIFIFLFSQETFANTKQELIDKANAGDIQAMVSLNKMIYAFPENKEGLQYYNKWYEQISSKTKKEDIIKFAKVFGKYKDMFINGNLKYEHLLKLAKDKDSKEALFMLLELYDEDDFVYAMRLNIKDKLIKNGTKEDFIKLYKSFNNSYENNISTQIYKQMIKKAYIKEKTHNFSKLKESFYKSKKEVPSILKKILNSNDIEDIYNTAQYLRNKYKYKKDAIKFYEKALKLTKDDNIKKEIFYELGKIYYSKEHKKAQEYLEKASALNNKYATNLLLEEYSQKRKNLKKYLKLKKELSNSLLGKKIFAEYIYENYSKYYAYELLEHIAQEKDEEAIINLALTSIKENSSYSFSPETFLISQKWQEYILNQDSLALLKKLQENLSKYYGEEAEELEKKIKEKISSSNNIMELRKKYEDYGTSTKKEVLELIKKAMMQGDIKSYFELAYKYLRKKEIYKAIKIYEELIKKGDLKAKTKLALLYIGEGNYLREKEQKVEKAIKYLEEASSAGYTKATESLIDLYMCKNCQPESKQVLDYKKAKYYIDKLIPLNNHKALYKLAYMYHNGLVVKQDSKKALELYKKAYNYAFQLAFEKEYSAYNIGIVYYKGQGNIKQDIKQAKYWLNKANNKEAKNILKAIDKEIKK